LDIRHGAADPVTSIGIKHFGQQMDHFFLIFLWIRVKISAVWNNNPECTTESFLLHQNGQNNSRVAGCRGRVIVLMLPDVSQCSNSCGMTPQPALFSWFTSLPTGQYSVSER